MPIRHQPIAVPDLRERLRSGFVRFSFVKKDGSLREVHGTVNLHNVPVTDHPTGHGNPSENTIRFWDLLTSGWRSAQVTTKFFIME
jgi:hypothetical protein